MKYCTSAHPCPLDTFGCILYTGKWVRRYLLLSTSEQVPRFHRKPQSHAGPWDNCAAVNRVPKYYLPPLVPSGRFACPFFTFPFPRASRFAPSDPSTPYLVGRTWRLVNLQYKLVDRPALELSFWETRAIDPRDSCTKPIQQHCFGSLERNISRTLLR